MFLSVVFLSADHLSTSELTACGAADFVERELFVRHLNKLVRVLSDTPFISPVESPGERPARDQYVPLQSDQIYSLGLRATL